jgi:hypothetical protein
VQQLLSKTYLDTSESAKNYFFVTSSKLKVLIKNVLLYQKRTRKVHLNIFVRYIKIPGERVATIFYIKLISEKICYLTKNPEIWFLILIRNNINWFKFVAAETGISKIFLNWLPNSNKIQIFNCSDPIYFLICWMRHKNKKDNLSCVRFVNVRISADKL